MRSRRVRSGRVAVARRERGIALVLVLWLTILMTVIASGFAYTMRSEALAARNAMSIAQARALADGAVQRTVYELIRPRAPDDPWAPDGQPHVWIENDARVAVSAVDESGRIDLNAATEPILKNLLKATGGVDDDTAAHIVDAVLDWRDPDDLKRPNGAEAADYEAAGLKYKPSNAPFETVAELQRVMGMTPELYARIADSLTVHTHMPGVNPLYASRGTLLAFPGATPEMVDLYLAQRRDALAAHLPVPPFPLQTGFASGPTATWRIRAEVTMPDNVTFIREAVMKPSPDVRRGPIALVWQEGDRRMLNEPANGTATTNGS